MHSFTRIVFVFRKTFIALPVLCGMRRWLAACTMAEHMLVAAVSHLHTPYNSAILTLLWYMVYNLIKQCVPLACLAQLTGSVGSSGVS